MLNRPSPSDQALSQFMTAAKGSSNSAAPANAQGGNVGPPPSSSSATTSGSGTAATTPAGGDANTLGAFSVASVAVMLIAMMLV
jgi:hypothetical protein